MQIVCNVQLESIASSVHGRNLREYRLGDCTELWGQVGTVSHIEIGSRAQVGNKSGVSKNVPPGEGGFGYPAMALKETKETVARLSRLSRLFQRVKRLEQNARETRKTLPPET